MYTRDIKDRQNVPKNARVIFQEEIYAFDIQSNDGRVRTLYINRTYLRNVTRSLTKVRIYFSARVLRIKIVHGVCRALLTYTKEFLLIVTKI